MLDLLEPAIAEAYKQVADAERRAAVAPTATGRKEWRLVAKQWRLIIGRLERIVPPKPPKH
jgi:hypothetical protein